MSVITMQPTANNSILENASPEVPSDSNSEEEEKKKKRQDDELTEAVEDCCCYFDEESFVLLRWISEICQCMVTCTEHCCDSCGDCVHNSCEGNDNGTSDDCCDCWGSSNNDQSGGDSDCDCDCTS